VDGNFRISGVPCAEVGAIQKERNMRHIQKISNVRVEKADQFQDAVCAVVTVFAAILQSFGGASPIATYLDSKCSFETPDA